MPRSASHLLLPVKSQVFSTHNPCFHWHKHGIPAHCQLSHEFPGSVQCTLSYTVGISDWDKTFEAKFHLILCLFENVWQKKSSEYKPQLMEQVQTNFWQSHYVLFPSLIKRSRVTIGVRGRGGQVERCGQIKQIGWSSSAASCVSILFLPSMDANDRLSMCISLNSSVQSLKKNHMPCSDPRSAHCPWSQNMWSLNWLQICTFSQWRRKEKPASTKRGRAEAFPPSGDFLSAPC